MDQHQIEHHLLVRPGIEGSEVAKFQTPEFYVEVQMKKNGELQVRCSDGALAVFPKSSNEVEIRCEPWWPDRDATRIAQHLIDTYTPEEAAIRIVDALRGRPFR